MEKRKMKKSSVIFRGSFHISYHIFDRSKKSPQYKNLYFYQVTGIFSLFFICGALRFSKISKKKTTIKISTYSLLKV